MSRRKIVAGNWKMNTSFESGMELTKNISNVKIPSDVEVILGIPFVFLKSAIDELESNDQVNVSAQNCHSEVSGAYTGEVSVNMLDSISCRYVSFGHSERRQYFNENNELLASKVDKAYA